LRAAGLRREESRGCLEDLVGAAQLAHLGAELAQLSGLLAAHPRAFAVIDFGLADPLAQCLRAADAQLRGYGADRRPVRRVVRPHLGDHPDRPLTQLRRIARSTSHDSIFLSQDGASGNPGTVQTVAWRT
jgi:hypothetical protein